MSQIIIDEKAARMANLALIPERSRKIYEVAYERFVKWVQEHHGNNYSEDVLLEYFSYLSRKLKSPSLYAQYSMIKAQLGNEHGVRIEKYSKLISFMKHKNKDHKPKQSKVFTREEFDKYLYDAPNNIHLASKVLLIFGVHGACRCDELLKLNINDIEDFGKLALVKIPKYQANKFRTFTIIGEFYLEFYREYAALRPSDLKTTRFFIKYLDGRCHRAVMGVHKIAAIPKLIATFLKLNTPVEYTGHCFRRTSSTLLPGLTEPTIISSTTSGILQEEDSSNQDDSYNSNHINQDNSDDTIFTKEDNYVPIKEEDIKEEKSLLENEGNMSPFSTQNHRNADTTSDIRLVSIVQPTIRDECQAYGEYIILKLRNYDNRTKFTVQHLFNEIIYKADMGEYK